MDDLNNQGSNNPNPTSSNNSTNDTPPVNNNIFNINSEPNILTPQNNTVNPTAPLPADPNPQMNEPLFTSNNVANLPPKESTNDETTVKPSINDWASANAEVNQKFGDNPYPNLNSSLDEKKVNEPESAKSENNLDNSNPSSDIPVEPVTPTLDNQPVSEVEPQNINFKPNDIQQPTVETPTSVSENTDSQSQPTYVNFDRQPPVSTPADERVVEPEIIDTSRRDAEIKPEETLVPSENTNSNNPNLSSVDLGYGNRDGSDSSDNINQNLNHTRISFVFKIFVGFLALIFFVVIIIFISALISGHKNSNNGKVTLTYWGLWEDSNIMQGVISDFERVHPNIIINYEKQDPKDYSARLLSRINNGTGPDIFRYHNSWVPELLPVLAPLPSSVITPTDFSKNYYSVIKSDLSKNGAIYGLPLDIDTLALFTNDKLFQAAGVKVPKTWNDFVNDSRLLTVKDENNKIQTAGAAFGTYDNITHASDINALLFAQNGVDFNNFSKTESSGVDALTFYTSFANSASGVNTNTNVWDESLPTSIKYFASGKVAMYFGYSWDIFTIQALNPNLSFSINPVPHLPNRNMTIASYWVEGISNKSKNQKEANEFLAYLTKTDTMQKLYQTESQTRPFGELYPRSDMANLLANNKLIYPFVQQASNATSSYFSGETEDNGINAQMNGYLANAINSVLGNTSSQTAMDTLTKGVAQVLNQYAKQNSSK